MSRNCLFLLFLFAVSCAEKAQDTSSSDFSSTNEASETQKLEQRFKTHAASGFIQDKKGNWITDTGKRSSFEAKGTSKMAGRQFDHKQFQKRDANLPAYWSQSEYRKQPYTGNTDASAFAKSDARQQLIAREVNQANNFGDKKISTPQYGNRSALEQQKSLIEKIDHSRTTNRRYYSDSEAWIMDVKQTRDLNIQQTKSIMGR